MSQFRDRTWARLRIQELATDHFSQHQHVVVRARRIFLANLYDFCTVIFYSLSWNARNGLSVFSPW